MGWDAMMFGDFEFPAGGVEAWKELVIEDGLFEDKTWKSSHWMGDPGETTTVAGLIAKLEDHSRWCEKTYRGADHQRLTIDGDKVSFRAYINEDDFRSWCGLVAMMFRVGEKVGATGEYFAIANDDMGGERLVVENGRSRIEAFDGVESMYGDGGDVPEQMAHVDAIIHELMATMAEKLERIHGSPPAKNPAPKKVKAKKAATKKVAKKKVAKKKVAKKKTAMKKTAKKKAAKKK